VPNNAREARWRDHLKPYYEELGIDPALPDQALVSIDPRYFRPTEVDPARTIGEPR
jgi:GDP-D-mannose dehydratase